jgi:hypothetical protein
LRDDYSPTLTAFETVPLHRLPHNGLSHANEVSQRVGQLLRGFELGDVDVVRIGIFLQPSVMATRPAMQVRNRVVSIAILRV